MQLIKRLENEDAEDLIGPMRECGATMALVCVCCGLTKDVPIRCKRRYCPACQPKLAAEKVARWTHAISKIQWPLFLTLTMANSHDVESIHYIKKRWQAFRRRKLIVERIKGGVASYEITNKGKGWHPHIHAICDCRWLSLHVPEPLRTDNKETVAEKCKMAQREVSSLWANQIKQDTAIVDVRRVYDSKKIVLEVLKYAMKGTDLVASKTPIAPLLRALKGSRLLAGWGSLHPMPELDPEEEPELECPKCKETKSYMPADIVMFMSRTTSSTSQSDQVPVYRETK